MKAPVAWLRLAIELATLALIIALSISIQSASALEFWVSPTGDDVGPGSVVQPFRSLERARDAARALKRPLSQPVIINLFGGLYRLERPLELDWRDSGQAGAPIVWQSAIGQDAQLWGSVRIGGWQLFDAESGIYVAPTPPVRSRQFYINGQRAQRARTSDNPASFVPQFIPDYLPRPDNPATPCSPPPTQGPVTGSGGIEYIVDPLNAPRWRDPSSWTNQDQIEAVLLAQWKSMRVRVEAVTQTPGLFHSDSQLITMQTPGWWNANMFRSAPVAIPGIGDDLFPAADGEPTLWSFWKVDYFENALEFLDEPGEWYLDETDQRIYYIARPGEDLATADAELPVIEALIDAHGTAEDPLHHVRFQNLRFAYATWLGPSSADGYVSDQSGFHVIGDDHQTNLSGHVEHVARTPGNLRFEYVQDMRFTGNHVTHMGGVGLDAGRGSQRLTILGNLFEDIASAAIQLGGVEKIDARPQQATSAVRNNTVSDNRIQYTGQDYFDAAAIFVGFSADTLVAHNSIDHVPWSGIAFGWGWGLLDPGSFPGVPNACPGDWGWHRSPTINRRNRIISNRIEHFLEKLWDGGAIYTLGQQGPNWQTGLLIAGNVASGKRPDAGANIFYTDGGSRYIALWSNAEFDNPIGIVDFGQSGPATQQLPNTTAEILELISMARFPYGGSIGGCRTFGDNAYEGNFMQNFSFYDPCPFGHDGLTYPVNLQFQFNTAILSQDQVPDWVINQAGVRPNLLESLR